MSGAFFYLPFGQCLRQIASSTRRNITSSSLYSRSLKADLPYCSLALILAFNAEETVEEPAIREIL
ncbi:hypothetical protein FBBNIHIM_09305 [Pseudocitrobacter vendiensis]|uniref:Uncharacterized protein n=1 Tax=Pseudocitrobacter vendiensis TaxID=2488306 RepID=A0ABM9F857_9ENTR|nr:hypothetical protein FBBNIHIM_09305 [Pseudocitrobacter vendiensis]